MLLISCPKIGRVSFITEWSKSNKKSFKVEEGGRRVPERDVVLEAVSGRCYIGGLEYGGRRLYVNENTWSLEAGKSKEMDSTLQFPERNAALLIL